jgi:hypothetical protein
MGNCEDRGLGNKGVGTPGSSPHPTDARGWTLVAGGVVGTPMIERILGGRGGQ